MSTFKDVFIKRKLNGFYPNNNIAFVIFGENEKSERSFIVEKLAGAKISVETCIDGFEASRKYFESKEFQDILGKNFCLQNGMFDLFDPYELRALNDFLKDMKLTDTHIDFLVRGCACSGALKDLVINLKLNEINQMHEARSMLSNCGFKPFNRHVIWCFDRLVILDNDSSDARNIIFTDASGNKISFEKLHEASVQFENDISGDIWLVFKNKQFNNNKTALENKTINDYNVDDYHCVLIKRKNTPYYSRESVLKDLKEALENT